MSETEKDVLRENLQEEMNTYQGLRDINADLTQTVLANWDLAVQMRERTMGVSNTQLTLGIIGTLGELIDKTVYVKADGDPASEERERPVWNEKELLFLKKNIVAHIKTLIPFEVKTNE